MFTHLIINYPIFLQSHNYKLNVSLIIFATPCGANFVLSILKYFSLLISPSIEFNLCIFIVFFNSVSVHSTFLFVGLCSSLWGLLFRKPFFQVSFKFYKVYLSTLRLENLANLVNIIPISL